MTQKIIRRNPTEAAIERRLFEGVRRIGGRAMKLQRLPGMPDRLVLWPKGECTFVEVKKPTGRLAKHQELAHSILRDLGHEVATLWTMEQVDEWLADREQRYAKEK